jgi:hypothetical protein
MIPGSSTINFDEITKERIFQAIDSANMQLFSDLKKDYNLLKFKLGRTPMMMDFIMHGSRDPFLYVDYANSYYNFIVKVEKAENSALSDQQVKLLELFSKEINNSKRVEESLILRLLIEQGNLSVKELNERVLKKYRYGISEETIKSCVSNLNFEFVRERKDGQMLSAKEIYDVDILSIESGSFVFSSAFKSHLYHDIFKRFLLDSASYSIYEFDRLFDADKWQNGFVLYRKYSRKDVFRILNVSENPVAQNVGGYLVSPDNEHCPIFVNYHKEEHISESTKYEDEFVNNKEFDWMSKSNRTLSSNDVQSILGHNGPIRLPLFIKKNNDEGIDFYYMGEVSPELDQVEQTTMSNDKGKRLPVVKIRFNLADPVSSTMYNYLQEKSVIKNIKPEKASKVIPIQQSMSFNEELRNPIPLYDFNAAAGEFGDLTERRFTLIEGPEKGSAKGYFACRIIGESMNRVIPNGSICIFKPYTGGSRNGKIVLAQYMEFTDPDSHSSFTIKTYTSEKTITQDGWGHDSIVLRPNSFDSSYQSISITEDSKSKFKVVGEFVEILKNCLEK